MSVKFVKHLKKRHPKVCQSANQSTQTANTNRPLKSVITLQSFQRKKLFNLALLFKRQVIIKFFYKTQNHFVRQVFEAVDDGGGGGFVAADNSSVDLWSKHSACANLYFQIRHLISSVSLGVSV